MMLNEHSSVADEHKKHFRKEKVHINRIKQEECVYRVEILKQKNIKPGEFNKPE